MINARTLKKIARKVNNLDARNLEATEQVLVECRTKADEGYGSTSFYFDGVFETKKGTRADEWYQPEEVIKELSHLGFITWLEEEVLTVQWDLDCPVDETSHSLEW